MISLAAWMTVSMSALSKFSTTKRPRCSAGTSGAVLGAGGSVGGASTRGGCSAVSGLGPTGADGTCGSASRDGGGGRGAVTAADGGAGRRRGRRRCGNAGRRRLPRSAGLPRLCRWRKSRLGRIAEPHVDVAVGPGDHHVIGGDRFQLASGDRVADAVARDALCQRILEVRDRVAVA